MFPLLLLGSCVSSGINIELCFPFYQLKVCSTSNISNHHYNLPIGEIPDTVQVNLATSPCLMLWDFGLLVNFNPLLSSPVSEYSLTLEPVFVVDIEVLLLTEA